MTRYEQGFLTKCAENGLSESDVAMLIDYVNSQKADAAKKETQNKEMRSMNRRKRVRNAKAKMMLLLGGAGAAAGAIVGKHKLGKAKMPAILGGIGGAAGGLYLGGAMGNREADKQEELEDRTGQSIAIQNIGREARHAGNMATWSLVAPILRGH